MGAIPKKRNTIKFFGIVGIWTVMIHGDESGKEMQGPACERL